jgi:hypothetical protein
MSFVAVTGFVFDGARVMTAYARASDTAENAARLGSQYFTGIRANHPVLDPLVSMAAMRHYLQLMRADSSVSTVDDKVTVTVTAHVPMRILGLFGVPAKSVRVTRSAEPVLG